MLNICKILQSIDLLYDYYLYGYMYYVFYIMNLIIVYLVKNTLINMVSSAYLKIVHIFVLLS